MTRTFIGFCRGLLASIAALASAGAIAAGSLPESAQMEADLQRLSWPQFKSVVEAIPKLKADIDAYGSLGWQYARANYGTYAWRKNIDKMDEEQKRRLADLIRRARGGGRSAVGGGRQPRP